MNSKVNMENRFFTFLCILFLAISYCLPMLTSILGLASYGKVTFFQLGPLTIPSLLLFLILIFFATWRIKLYFLFLIFVILAFPAPIDDIFPSVPLTNTDDREQVVFPLFTRIDFYLLLGIFLRLVQTSAKMKAISFTVILKVFLSLFFLVFVVNAFKSKDLWDFNLFLSYAFHIRYLILFLILLQLYDIKEYQKEIVYGFVMSLLFLLFEAGINTLTKGSGRLLSGSLSLNTFANISAAIGLYLFFLIKQKQISRGMGYLGLITMVIILIGSGTRGAILSIILAYLLIYLISYHKGFVIALIKTSLAIIALIVLYVSASYNNLISDRYSLQEISKKTQIDFSESNLSEIIKVKITKETTSIKSRLDLFESSIHMIKENPWTGIGVGRWNRYKNEYNEEDKIPKVLLDTHNDYLALTSQYGLPLGLFFAYLIFIYPMVLYKRRKDKTPNQLSALYVICIVMAVAGLSNAGFFKHQIAAVLIFSLCTTLKLHANNGGD